MPTLSMKDGSEKLLDSFTIRIIVGAWILFSGINRIIFSISIIQLILVI